MRINGYEGDFARTDDGTVIANLACTMAEALALDGQTITAADDGGELATFPHYAVESIVNRGDGTVSITARRTVDETTATLVDSLTARLDAIDKALSGIRAVTDALKSSKLLGLTVAGEDS